MNETSFSDRVLQAFLTGCIPPQPTTFQDLGYRFGTGYIMEPYWMSIKNYKPEKHNDIGFEE